MMALFIIDGDVEGPDSPDSPVGRWFRRPCVQTDQAQHMLLVEALLRCLENYRSRSYHHDTAEPLT